MCRADHSSILFISISTLYNFLLILSSAPHFISEPSPFPPLRSSPQLGLFSLVSLLFLIFPTELDLSISSPPFLYVLVIILSYHESLCSLWTKRTFPSQVLFKSLTLSFLSFCFLHVYTLGPSMGKVVEGYQCPSVVYPK